MSSFVDLGVSPRLVQLLERHGITDPTPIQAKAIPIALTGQDLIGLAQTGTGKTLAFGLPLIMKLQDAPGTALVLAPTRELALQIEESISSLTKNLPNSFRTAVLIGGAPIAKQIQDLRRGPSLVVATPGRLNDLLEQRKIFLHQVGVFVIDEADRMFDMGFAPQVKRIASQISGPHQTMLFSATMSADVVALAAAFQKNPVRIEASPAGTSAVNVTHELCFVNSKEGKTQLLNEILKGDHKSVLIFSRTKHGASRLSQTIVGMGHRSTDIHSNKSLSQRRRALDGFKSGQYRVLVATDIAARGIDVADISLVINFDLPDAPSDYIHRIGRTGRAGKSGLAVSLATVDQLPTVREIERLISQTLPLSAASLPRPVFASSRPGGSFQRRQPSRRPYRR